MGTIKHQEIKLGKYFTFKVADNNQINLKSMLFSLYRHLFLTLPHKNMLLKLLLGWEGTEKQNRSLLLRD